MGPDARAQGYRCPFLQLSLPVLLINDFNHWLPQKVSSASFQVLALTITCTCWYDVMNRTQDHKIYSNSQADSQILPLLNCNHIPDASRAQWIQSCIHCLRRKDKQRQTEMCMYREPEQMYRCTQSTATRQSSNSLLNSFVTSLYLQSHLKSWLVGLVCCGLIGGLCLVRGIPCAKLSRTRTSQGAKCECDLGATPSCPTISTRTMSFLAIAISCLKFTTFVAPFAISFAMIGCYFCRVGMAIYAQLYRANALQK